MSKREDKGKGVMTPKTSKAVKTSFKTITMTNPDQVKKQKFDETPKEERLRDDAYKIALEATHPGEYVFPYIPTSTKWVVPIENKYLHYKPNEVASIYFKNHADSFVFPKDFQYFQDILVATSSVEFDSMDRSGGEIAYSKATIHRVIRPDQWTSDLFQPYEMTRQLRHKSVTLKFNYFNYVDAWEHAFYYENKQRKFSWWIQFSNDFGKPELPNWFNSWFIQWGLYPICLPDKVRSIYDDFERINESLTNPSLWFTVLYQVPWIIRWEPIIAQRNLSKLGQKFKPIPYLGKRILIRWWQKFQFFEKSVFATKGLINLEPPKPPKPDISQIFKEFTSKISKDDLAQIMAMLKQEEETGSSQLSRISTGRPDGGTESSSQKTEDEEMIDELMDDSQDPFGA